MMEWILGGATVLGGIAALHYFWRRWRNPAQGEASPPVQRKEPAAASADFNYPAETGDRKRPDEAGQNKGQESSLSGHSPVETAGAELGAIAETRDRDAALDKKAVLLTEFCFDAFCQKVAQLKKDRTLSDRSSVVKAGRPGAVFALDPGSSYRGAQSGISAFQYRLSARNARAQVTGWIQVEVPDDSRVDPVLVVRWNPTLPSEPATTVFQQLASGFANAGSVSLVREQAARQMRAVLGMAMTELLHLVKEETPGGVVAAIKSHDIFTSDLRKDLDSVPPAEARPRGSPDDLPTSVPDEVTQARHATGIQRAEGVPVGASPEIALAPEHEKGVARTPERPLQKAPAGVQPGPGRPIPCGQKTHAAFRW